MAPDRKPAILYNGLAEKYSVVAILFQGFLQQEDHCWALIHCSMKLLDPPIPLGMPPPGLLERVPTEAPAARH